MVETNIVEKPTALDRAGSIAADALKKIQEPAKAKAAEEAKVASESKAKADEQIKKDEGLKVAQEQAKVKEDERVLGTDDAQLKDSEKTHKAKLLAKKKEEENTPDAKIKRIQEQTQKRIDELKSQLLEKDNKSAEEIKALKAKIEDIERPRKEENIADKVKRELAERNAKYVEEDKSKPKEDRREMSKQDLDEWYLEDPVAATKWINRNEYRRGREEDKAMEEAKKPVDTTEEKIRLAKEFADKQNESKAKLFSKFPGTNPSKDEIAAIKKDLGLPLDRVLTKDELTKINDSLKDKNKEFRMVQEIVSENPDKYLGSVDGPELVMAEMEKRLSGKETPKGGKIELTEEELQAKIDAEIERRRLIDGEGASSTTGAKKMSNSSNKKEKGKLTAEQERVAKKAGIGTEAYQKQLDRRDKIPGAGSGNDKED